ncbi:MAG: ComF family protein [Flavobacteriaceae bacterium]|nr:ComF family protein [Flavobacteriaceae bacterium]
MFLRSILDIFYPKRCLSCDDIIGYIDTYICIPCTVELSNSSFEDLENNYLERKMKSFLDINKCTYLFSYSKGGFPRDMVRKLKYKDREDIGVFLGDWQGQIIKNSKRFEDVDYIIKVPLHPKKLKIRGYNQLDKYAERVSFHTGIEVLEEFAFRKIHSETQTKKSKTSRWNSMNDVFEIKNKDILREKHILVVDDVVTTGATINSLCSLLIGIEGIKVSIASICCALK